VKKTITLAVPCVEVPMSDDIQDKKKKNDKFRAVGFLPSQKTGGDVAPRFREGEILVFLSKR